MNTFTFTTSTTCMSIYPPILPVSRMRIRTVTQVSHMPTRTPPTSTTATAMPNTGGLDSVRLLRTRSLASIGRDARRNQGLGRRLAEIVETSARFQGDKSSWLPHQSLSFATVQEFCWALPSTAPLRLREGCVPRHDLSPRFVGVLVRAVRGRISARIRQPAGGRCTPRAWRRRTTLRPFHFGIADHGV